MADNDHQQQQQQQQQQANQDLNFTIQDILGDNSSHDASFQSIVQNLGNNEEAYARLPAELQQLFSSNGTDDMGASDPAVQQHAQELLWNNNNKDQKPPSSSTNTTPTAQWAMPTTSMPPQQQPIMSHPSTPIQQQQAGTTTLLENITSQLSPERKEEFIDLFRKLQSNAVSPEQFFVQAKSMLGQQQYQQLEDLKNKPNQDGKDGNDKKRGGAQNIAQMAGLVTPQMKRPKTEHIPPGMPMGPPLSNPMAVFKTPTAVQGHPGLQIPRTAGPTALPGQQAPMKPPTSAPASGPATSGDRIDYDTLTDVMGYAGVDLREEVEHFLRDGEMVGGVLPDGVDRSKTQEFMNPELLKERVLEIAKPFAVSKADADCLSYLALATQERLRSLVEQMVAASKHRTLSQSVSAPPPLDENGHPVYKVVVQQDTKKQLLAIERAEREEERKRKELVAEKERRSQMGKGDGTGEEGRPKGKKKDKETQQRMGDGFGKGGGNSETALMKAIGVRKSWMLTGNSREQPGAMRQANEAPTGDDAPRGRGRPRGRKTGESKRGRGRGGLMRDGRDVGLFLPPSTIGRGHRLGDPGARKVTVRDATFVLERDCQAPGRGDGQRTLLKTYNQWLK